MADTYSGWANYETWAVKLWIDNEEGSHNYWREEAERCIAECRDKHPNEFADKASNRRIMLADALKQAHEDSAEEWMPDQSGVFADLFNSALGAVEWHEIAQSMLDDSTE